MKWKIFWGLTLSLSLTACSQTLHSPVIDSPQVAAMSAPRPGNMNSEIAPLPKGTRQPGSVTDPSAQGQSLQQNFSGVSSGILPRGWPNSLLPASPPTLLPPSPGNGQAPLPFPSSDISIIEKTTFHGSISDASGLPLGGMVYARSLNLSVPYEAATSLAGGTYAMNNVPPGIEVEITAVLTDHSILRRVEIPKVNKYGNSDINRYDFQVGVTPTATPAPGQTPYPLPSPTPTPTMAPTPLPTPQPDTTPYPSPEPTATPFPQQTPAPLANSDFFYFSYDDSASTAGVELSKYALSHHYLPSTALLRPWEFLNSARFNSSAQESHGLFKISMGIWKYPAGEQTGLENYEFGAHISSPQISRAQRRNLVLTLVVDVSGSMQELSQPEKGISKLSLVQASLKALKANLKAGDSINLVSFSDAPRVRFENYQLNGSIDYEKTIMDMTPEGGTNLEAGMKQAYALANKYYDPNKINRVIMLTDAYATAGDTDVNRVSYYTRINNAEGIYFSGLGFGQNFNEAFLNQLTEAGKGAYFSMITLGDVERAMGERFMGLINVAARDVRFRLEYPKALKRAVSAAEQSSQEAEKVQTSNFSYNTSQFFLEQMQAPGDSTILEQKIRLSIAYTDPVSYQPKLEWVEKTVGELIGKDLENIKDAHLVTLLPRFLKNELNTIQVSQELDLLGERKSALAQEYLELLKIAQKLK